LLGSRGVDPGSGPDTYQQQSSVPASSASSGNDMTEPVDDLPF